MVGIECDDAAFYVISRRSTSEIVLQEKILQASGKLDYSRYSQVSLLTLCDHWQTLSNSFIFTPHAQRERGKVIDRGVYIIGERVKRARHS